MILAGCVIAIVMFNIPEWDRDLITSGAYKNARQLSTENLESSLRAGRLRNTTKKVRRDEFLSQIEIPNK